jgi:hypothetical protein
MKAKTTSLAISFIFWLPGMIAVLGLAGSISGILSCINDVFSSCPTNAVTIFLFYALVGSFVWSLIMFRRYLPVSNKKEKQAKG